MVGLVCTTWKCRCFAPSNMGTWCCNQKKGVHLMDATAYTLHIYRYNILPPPKESPSPGDQLRFFSRLSLPFMTGLYVRLRRGPKFPLRLAGFKTCVESRGSDSHML